MYGNNFYTQTQITQINGENGAKAYTLPPNSSALLLDSTAPLVWCVVTDGAGYKTCTPYTITPYAPEPAPDLNTIIERLDKLEEKINAKSNTKQPKQPTNE